MTTANPGGVGLEVGPEPETQADLRGEAAQAGRAPLGSGLAAGWRSVRDALDKPLASYYLLLGSSALLLTIGVIMVLSASSVRSYLTYDDSYAVVKRQLMWVALGLPRRVGGVPDPRAPHPQAGLPRVPGRPRPPRARRPLRRAHQRQQELARPRPRQHPAGGDRQARHRALGRQHLRPQGAAPARAAPPPRAGGARAVRRHRPRAGGPRPRHRDGAGGHPARDAVGRRGATAALRAQPLGARRRRGRPRRHRSRAARAHHPLHGPLQGLHRRGLAAGPRALRPVQRRLVRAGHRRLHAEVGRPARGPHRLHLRRPRRGARSRRHAAGHRAVLHHRLRRGPRRPQHRGPLRPLRDLRHRGLAARPDDDQRRHGARRPAGHRHPAPDRVLRRVGPAAFARGPRTGDRLRAPRAGGRCRARRTPTQPLRRTLRGSRSR